MLINTSFDYNNIFKRFICSSFWNNTITINRWDRRRVDNEATGKLISDLFERHYQGGSKTKVYNEIKEEILKTEGRTMSKSTFYRYIKENKETIKLIPLISETDISNFQSNAG